MNAKLIIAALFILMVILGVTGVVLYYKSLAPLRDVKECTTVGDVLDRVKYLEYNITDQAGNFYLVKVYNDPATRSGTIEYYGNNTLIAKASYTYGTRLESFSISYLDTNTSINASGTNIYIFEDKFYTSLNMTYNETVGITGAEPFPGIAPIYMICYVGKANDINWDYYASIIKPRNYTLGVMDVQVSYAKTLFLGEETDALLVRLVRRGTAINMWTYPLYEFVLVDYNGLAVANTIIVDIAMPQYTNTFVFHLVDIQLAG